MQNFRALGASPPDTQTSPPLRIPGYAAGSFWFKLTLVWKYEMEYMEKNFSMEWKKIARMEYGKIVFHSIPCHALARKT